MDNFQYKGERTRMKRRRIRLNEECLYDINGTTDLSSCVVRVVPVEKTGHNKYKVVPLTENCGSFECDSSLLTPFDKHTQPVVIRQMFGTTLFVPSDIDKLKYVKQSVDTTFKMIDTMLEIIKPELKETCPANGALDKINEVLDHTIEGVEKCIQQDLAHQALMLTDEGFKRMVEETYTSPTSQDYVSIDKLYDDTRDRIEIAINKGMSYIVDKLNKNKVQPFDHEEIDRVIDECMDTVSKMILRGYSKGEVKLPYEIPIPSPFDTFADILTESVMKFSEELRNSRYDCCTDEELARIVIFITGTSTKSGSPKYANCMLNLHEIDECGEELVKKATSAFSNEYVVLITMFDKQQFHTDQHTTEDGEGDEYDC